MIKPPLHTFLGDNMRDEYNIKELKKPYVSRLNSAVANGRWCGISGSSRSPGNKNYPVSCLTG